MPITTPAAITPQITAFIRSFAADDPIMVPVVPAGAPLRCFENCQEVVAKDGGKAILGWTIWERAGAFIEAEHHCVVQRNDGSLVDVTPHDGETQILFVRDPTATYNGKVARGNHRHALADDADVISFLSIAETVGDINRRLRMYGVEKVTNAQKKELHKLFPEMSRLERLLATRYPGLPVT